jgi:hypothetical protein
MAGASSAAVRSALRLAVRRTISSSISGLEVPFRKRVASLGFACSPWPNGAVLVRLLGTFDRKLACGGEWGRVSPSQEVAVRPPEVFVRDLTAQEGARLKSISSAPSISPSASGR